MQHNPGNAQNIALDDEISLLELWRILVRGLPFVVLVALGASTLTFVLTSRMQPMFRSTATVLANRTIVSDSFGVSLVTAPAIDASAYRAAAKSFPVLANARDILGGKYASVAQVDQLAESIDVRAEQNSSTALLRISATSYDPVLSADLANAVADALLEWDRNRATNGLKSILGTLDEQISALDAEISRLSTSGANIAEIASLESLRAERFQQRNAANAMLTSAVGHLETLESALVPVAPFSPRSLQSSALAFVLGLLLACMFVFIREALDARFRGVDELARATGLPVLAEFPRLSPSEPHLPVDGLGFLRTNLQFATASDYPRIILVTSPGPGQGKTSLATGLAWSFAANDYKTLLIDGDLRRPKASSVLSASESQSTTLEEVLTGSRDFAPTKMSLGGVRFDLLPTFVPARNPTEIISAGIVNLLQRVRPTYDVIIIDSAPVLPVADSLIMASHATGVLVAVSILDTHRSHAKAAVELLGRIGSRIVGLAATNLPTSRLSGRTSTYGYGYGSHSQVGSTHPDAGINAFGGRLPEVGPDAAGSLHVEAHSTRG